jgi:5-methylcytosine-specific restriction endonuclease McrA
MIKKECLKCGEIKNISEFHKSKTTEDRYQDYCKKCVLLYQDEYYGMILERMKPPPKLPEITIEEKIKFLEILRGQEKNNIDKLTEAEKEEIRKERRRERDYYYRKTEKAKEHKRKARIKRRATKQDVRFSIKQRKDLLDRDNWTCQICGIKVHDSAWRCNAPDKANVDHIVPISKGGTSELSNLRILCQTCNLMKGDKLDSEMEPSL